jgi:hypothetical protein
MADQYVLTRLASPGAPPKPLLLGWDSLVSCRLSSIVYRSTNCDVEDKLSCLVSTLSTSSEQAPFAKGGRKDGHPVIRSAFFQHIAGFVIPVGPGSRRAS